MQFFSCKAFDEFPMLIAKYQTACQSSSPLKNIELVFNILEMWQQCILWHVVKYAYAYVKLVKKYSLWQFLCLCGIVWIYYIIILVFNYWDHVYCIFYFLVHFLLFELCFIIELIQIFYTIIVYGCALIIYKYFINIWVFVVREPKINQCLCRGK